MKVNGSSAAGVFNEATSVQAQSKSMTQEDFMKIFLTQMKTQDPTKPLNSSDMLQQMSQMTNLSATKDLEKTIKLLNSNMGNSQVLQATQMIGKKVSVASETSPLNQKDGLGGSVVLPAKATDITVEIRDKEDKLIKTIKLEDSGSGLVDFHWDGKDAEGNMQSDEYYKISAKANINGETQDLYTAGMFNVNSVTLDRQSNSLILNVDGLGGIRMGDIIKILS